MAYTPQNARGVGGGYWVNTLRGSSRFGKRFRVTRQGGYLYHDYGGGRRVRVRRYAGFDGGAKAPAAPAAPKVPSPAEPPKAGGAIVPYKNDQGVLQSRPGAGAKPGAPSKKPADAKTALDAQGLQEQAQLHFQTGQQLADLAQQGAYDQTDVAEALRRMQTQQTDTEQQTRESANRAGLFYSGQLGKQMGDVQTQFGRQRFDQQTAYDRRQAARVASRQAILQGATLEEAAIAAEAADRQIQRDTEAADAGSLVREPGPAPAKPGPKKKHHRRRRRRHHHHRPRPVPPDTSSKSGGSGGSGHK